MSSSFRAAAAGVFSVALIGLSAAHIGAQTVTRADQATEARAQKAGDLQTHQRSMIERVLFKLEDDLLLERLFASPRGIYVRLGGVGESSGFGLGPAYRYNTAAFDFKTTAAVSIKKYSVVEASIRFPGTLGQDAYIKSLGPYVDLQGRRRDLPQEDYFGLGPASELAARSNYARTDVFGGATGGVAWDRVKAGVSVGYLDVLTGSGEDSRMPSSEDVLPPDQLLGFGEEPSFLTVEPFLEITMRDRAKGEKSGGVYRVSAAQFDDRTLGRYSFRRWEADLRQFIGFQKDTRSLALRAWAAATTPAGGSEMPFYMQPTLGGANTLRGYRLFRFRDRSALLLQTEYRWRINEFVSGALFYDTGAVAPTLKDLGRLERNYGFGLRAGGRLGSAFRFDVALGGREGIRYLLRFDDVF